MFTKQRHNESNTKGYTLKIISRQVSVCKYGAQFTVLANFQCAGMFNNWLLKSVVIHLSNLSNLNSNNLNEL